MLRKLSFMLAVTAAIGFAAIPTEVSAASYRGGGWHGGGGSHSGYRGSWHGGAYRGYYGGYRGRYYGGGWDWGGFAAGAILGGLLAAPYYYGNAYYYPGPGYYYGPPPGDGVAYCMRRFRSYDPRSGTYIGNDGYRHPCP